AGGGRPAAEGHGVHLSGVGVGRLEVGVEVRFVQVGAEGALDFLDLAAGVGDHLGDVAVRVDGLQDGARVGRPEVVVDELVAHRIRQDERRIRGDVFDLVFDPHGDGRIEVEFSLLEVEVGVAVLDGEDVVVVLRIFPHQVGQLGVDGAEAVAIPVGPGVAGVIGPAAGLTPGHAETGGLQVGKVELDGAVGVADGGFGKAQLGAPVGIQAGDPEDVAAAVVQAVSHAEHVGVAGPQPRGDLDQVVAGVAGTGVIDLRGVVGWVGRRGDEQLRGPAPVRAGRRPGGR